MKIGVDYYPEHWDASMWEQDADDMKEVGVRLVRLAEFAWGVLEPEEGVYDFSWLDQAIEVFAKRDIQVFLCTPTCTPPQWMFEKYPEVIQVGSDGRRISIGIRGHRCMESPVFRGFCEKIITQMVSRYKDNPTVIGYQIDNELESNQCRCPVCVDQFQKWIRKKYGTVAKVNEAYGNSVWSGNYSTFSQVNPPMGNFIQWQNPSLTLDYNRFASESTVDYIDFQRKLIQKFDPEAKITTNTWLCEYMIDFYDMFEKLDFVSYDNYPTTSLPKDGEVLYSHNFHLDLMRGIKKKNFWVMEQLSGAMGSWSSMSLTPRPGMIKGYSLQALAHGADTVVHFRWRSAVAGAEMYWHGIIDHNNVKGRRYKEFAELCKIVNDLQELDGSQVKNQVAMLYGSNQEYAFRLQHQGEGMHYFEQLKRFHDGFASLGIGVDIINETDSLEGYSVVIAPTLLVYNEKVKEHLYQFAKEGGTVILSNRSGVKDEFNKCIMEPLPTVYRDLAGVSVEEYDAIGARKCRLVAEKELLPISEDNESLCCEQWCDILQLEGAKALIAYGEEFYEGKPAVTVNQYEKGQVYYVGTVMNRAGYRCLIKDIAGKLGLEYYEDLPLGVELTKRQKGEEVWSFLFNNTDKIQKAMGKELQPFEMVIRKEA